MDERPYFLIPSAFLVEGASKMLIYDTERSENFSVPIKYRDFIVNKDQYTIEKAKEFYTLSEVEFNSIKSFLLSNDLLCFSEMVSFYQRIEPIFDYPSKVTNAIIDLKDNIDILEKCFSQLQAVNCLHYQIRYFRRIDKEEFRHLFSLLRNTFSFSIELAISCKEDLTEEIIVSFMHENPYIDTIIVYDSKFEGYSTVLESNGMQQNLYFTKQSLKIKSCGIVSPNYFTTSIPAFSESQSHNSCLNRKITIDFHGNIKNCPSMTKSFGHINDVDLAEILSDSDFRKLWDLSKDKILVCKDCEYRYSCTDCRAYVEDPKDITSKPLKCGYNPYDGEWTDWKKDPNKRTVIEFYEL